MRGRLLRRALSIGSVFFAAPGEMPRCRRRGRGSRVSGFELSEEVVIVGGLETEETRRSSTVYLRR